MANNYDDKKKELKAHFDKELNEYFDMLEDMHKHNEHLKDAPKQSFITDFNNYLYGKK